MAGRQLTVCYRTHPTPLLSFFYEITKDEKYAKASESHNTKIRYTSYGPPVNEVGGQHTNGYHAWLGFRRR